ncbi:MAG: queuosine salvage family protein [Patescibacteria group bacterium]
MNQVLSTTKYVLDRAKWVHINQEKLVEFAQHFQHGAKRHWLSEAPIELSQFSVEDRLHFICIISAMSFSFWGEPKWSIEHQGKLFDGNWGMIKALGRGIEEGVPLLDFKSISTVTRQDFAQVLRGNIEMPLFEERYTILQEVGHIITTQFDGKLSHLVKQAEGDALKLLDLVVSHFSSFHDTSVYNGKEICFYKRAQLLVADISQVFSGTEFGDLERVEQLTACADYKLPQILRKQGILEYSDDLAERIDQKVELSHDSDEEIEIRAHTIWAVELMTQEARKRIPGLMPIEVGDYLWQATQQKYPDDKPYHRTRTTAY